MKRRLLLSYLVSSAALALLYGVAMFGAAHQDGPSGAIGYLVAMTIGLPAIMIFGPETRHPDLALVVAALIDVNALALLIYLVWRARDRMPE